MSQKADVFIIDDDMKTLRYYQSIVNRGTGLRCIGISTKGERAIAILETTHPHIVLIDYALYPRSGFEIMAAIHKSLPKLPVILLGGRKDYETRAIEAGASAYLPMPITPRSLVDSIQKVLDAQKQDDFF